MSNVDWSSLEEAERAVADRMAELIRSHPVPADVADPRVIVRDIADERRKVFAERASE